MRLLDLFGETSKNGVSIQAVVASAVTFCSVLFLHFSDNNSSEQNNDGAQVS
jgi:hypothetical protein